MRKKSSCRSKHKKETSMKHKLAGIALATGLVAASAFAQNTGLATAAIEGVIADVALRTREVAVFERLEAKSAVRCFQ
jgi:hypothetical protein